MNTHVFDPPHLDAFARLLALPDPGDLPRRSHVFRCEGDPDRRETRLPAILMCWLQRRHLETDMEGPLASATPTVSRATGHATTPGYFVNAFHAGTEASQ